MNLAMLKLLGRLMSHSLRLKAINNIEWKSRAAVWWLIDLPSINNPQQINAPACLIQAGVLAWYLLKIM